MTRVPITALDWQTPPEPALPQSVDTERRMAHADRLPPRRRVKALKELHADLRRAAERAERHVAVIDARLAFLKPWEPLINYLKEAWMDRQEFFNMAVQPDGMPDTMDFVVRRTGDGAFSREAYESIGYQAHDFALARTLAQWKRTGVPPKGVKVRMSIEWDGPSDAELERDNVPPWYSVDSDQAATVTPVTLDGVHRLTSFLEAREEDA